VTKNEKKPKVKLLGRDGNIFSVVGAASKALRKAGQEEKATEMRGLVFSSQSYHAALGVIMRYVDVG
jgi:hypothetical protein